MKELVLYLAQSLAARPGEVTITETLRDDGALELSLKVAEEDLNHLIGKQGRTIKAMRSLLAAGASMPRRGNGPPQTNGDSSSAAVSEPDSPLTVKDGRCYLKISSLSAEPQRDHAPLQNDGDSTLKADREPDSPLAESLGRHEDAAAAAEDDGGLKTDAATVEA